MKEAKNEKKTMGIMVKKSEDMPEWYSQVCLKAELADYAPIKGCMVLRPYGYSVWQGIMDFFNAKIKVRGVKNAYFPMFIPESFFEKEKQHAEGFTPEVAWVQSKDGGERFAIRPTSETIMYDFYSRWIRSWRDLPLKINQWCNICRWEVQDCKLFLRSREFLWQEGHCAYETEDECEKDALNYLEDYRAVAEDLLAVPVILGEKTANERFAGAKKTFTIESLMPDGKALQLGTSHNLGQGFAKAFGIGYVGKDKKDHLPWQNSWGISWRMIGAMAMVHGDDKGLVIPPKAAATKVVIVPIIFEDSRVKVMKLAEDVKKELKHLDAFIDDRDEYNPGWKFNEWEMKGIPIRIEIGPKDVEKDQVVVVRRDTLKKEFVKSKDIKATVEKTLEVMQKDMFAKAKKAMQENIVEAKDYKDLVAALKQRKMVRACHCGGVECEDMIKFETQGATARLIPFNEKLKTGAKCIKCGKPANYIAYFAKAY